MSPSDRAFGAGSPSFVPLDRFRTFYDEGRPPWDIGRPQRDLVALADRVGSEVRDVLDVGCGTGELALFYASRGHRAWGVDMVPKAIEQARAKAAARGLSVAFRVADALALGELGRRFDLAVDAGLFHVFSDADRARYVESLAAALVPGGTLHLLCFSELTPGDVGPRRVTQAEIREAFARGFEVHEIAPAMFETLRDDGDQPRAWRAIIARVA